MAALTRAATPATLLRLGTRGARALLLLFVVTNGTLLAFSIGDVGRPLLAVAAYVVILATAPFLLLVTDRAFPVRLALLVASGPVLATAIISWQMPREGWPGYASWHIGAATMMLFVLALRGRVLIAWISFALMSALTLLWAVDVGQGVMLGVTLIDRNAAVLFVGSLIAVAIGRLAARITDLAADEAQRAGSIAAEQVAVAQRAEGLARLEQMALPFLRRVADGTDPAELRQDAVVLEGQLRDQVRAGALAVPLADAVGSARARGVDVRLLDDLRESPSEGMLAELTAFVRERLHRMTDGKLVVRLLPSGREVQATVLVARPDEVSERTDFP